MKKTNLEVIQIISKVLGIIAKVAMVLCLVGIIACIVGATVLVTVNIVSTSAVQQIEQESHYTVLALIGTCLCGMFMSLSGFLLSRLCRNYFLMEQQAGTPFTDEGAKSFRSLGIASVVIPMVAALICAIVSAIFNCDNLISYDLSIGTGIVMILLSFVFAYGAELEQGKAQDKKPEIEG